MCGRAAQSQRAVSVAASSFGLSVDTPPSGQDGERNDTTTTTDDNGERNDTTTTTDDKNNNDGPNAPASSPNHIRKNHPMEYEWGDNFNLSPGMDAMVFFKGEQHGELCVGRKVWGLVNKRGTPKNPLPPGMGKHFEGLMFNARSDTLFEKPSFARLANLGRSCIIAFDGFFEWKASVGGKGKKQPYFVRRKCQPCKGNSHGLECQDDDRPYLLMAGLWNQVPTGWDETPTLDTFTIITTDVCSPLAWLHTRMPVCVWDHELALQWLDKPTQKVLKLFEEGARQTPEGFFDFYPVTTDMSSTKFRSADALKPLPKVKSVKDYFMASLITSSKKKTAISDDSKSSTTALSKNGADQQQQHSASEDTHIVKSLSAATNSPATTKMQDSVTRTPTKRASTGNETSSPKKRAKTGPRPLQSVHSPHKRKGTIHAFFKPKTKG